MTVHDLPKSAALDAPALAQLFSEARTFNSFHDRPVARDLLEEAVRLATFGPTAANSVPARFLFLTTPEAKARIAPAMSDGNRAKTLAAPVVAVVAGDVDFPEQMIRTFPHAPDAKSWFAAPGAAEASASYNTALQTGYFIIALRALGLDAGPMGGFDKDKIDAEFFAGTKWKSGIVINIGYGDRDKLFPRNPRLPVPEITRFL